MADTNLYNSSRTSLKDEHPPRALQKGRRLLNPVDRISEIVFGLIMALSFTCTISVVESGKADVKDVLIGAIGCNLAWGLVDAIMFVLTGLAEQGRGRMILRYIRSTSTPEKAREAISDALPPVVSAAMKNEDFETVRKRLLDLPESSLRVRIKTTDIKMALGVFLLVFLSTFPVAIPFKFIDDIKLAMRVSNGIAIVLMFVGGWMLAGYSGYNKWRMGLFMVLLGILLVAITIFLGG
ncbi:VIT1/CCC1 transporter family protein [Pinibacter soli]|uniref:VIT1/CCC1 transporter family protein n=1 Tax=Pinibacter soli TaxID=3044211 RepID=A0ABT6REC7_9BACT|nr:VIT1/CCC1 transporter family protein [Pinibacter soli]MDI3320934.1 VIT1/CCC1 transporter family protein [Pinibacter soli]